MSMRMPRDVRSPVLGKAQVIQSVRVISLNALTMVQKKTWAKEDYGTNGMLCFSDLMLGVLIRELGRLMYRSS